MGISLSSIPAKPQFDGGAFSHQPYERVRARWAASLDDGGVALREFVSSPEEPLHINCEHLVQLIGDAQHDPSPFGRWVFEASAALLAAIPPDGSYIDNNQYSHTAKYLFCAACFTPPRRSVLDHPESLDLTTAVVDRAVAFCEMSHSLGTVPLIIRGIIVSNMREWIAQSDIRSFYVHPESLRSQGFLQLLRHAVAQENAQATPHSRASSKGRMATPHLLNRIFCEALTPEEFLVSALGHTSGLPVPELVGPLKTLLAAHLGEDAETYPFLTNPPGSSIHRPDQTNQLSAPRLSFMGGIYVDVFGTLIHSDGTPNDRLVQVVRDLMSRVPPRKVFLVSDSQDEEIARALSFFDDRPPLIHKGSLEGSELEYLIDNHEAASQGLHVRHHLLPEQAVQLAARLVEDDTMYAST
jgi:hypothetical protein